MRSKSFFLIALVLAAFSAPNLSFARDNHTALDQTTTQADSWHQIALVADATVPTPAPSVVVDPQSPTDEISLGLSVFAAAKSGNWSLAVALGIMFLLYLLRMLLLPRLDPKVDAWLPWLSASLGVLGAIAVNVVAGQSWLTAILSGLTVGAAASGLWSLIGSKLLPTPPAAGSAQT